MLVLALAPIVFSSLSLAFSYPSKNNILKLQFGLERFKEIQIDSDVLTCKAGVFCSVNDDATRPKLSVSFNVQDGGRAFVAIASSFSLQNTPVTC